MIRILYIPTEDEYRTDLELADLSPILAQPQGLLWVDFFCISHRLHAGCAHYHALVDALSALAVGNYSLPFHESIPPKYH